MAFMHMRSIEDPLPTKILHSITPGYDIRSISKFVNIVAYNIISIAFASRNHTVVSFLGGLISYSREQSILRCQVFNVCWWFQLYRKLLAKLSEEPCNHCCCLFFNEWHGRTINMFHSLGPTKYEYHVNHLKNATKITENYFHKRSTDICIFWFFWL